MSESQEDLKIFSRSISFFLGGGVTISSLLLGMLSCRAIALISGGLGGTLSPAVGSGQSPRGGSGALESSEDDLCKRGCLVNPLSR